MAYIQIKVSQRIADAVSQKKLAELARQYYSQTLPRNRVIDPQSADNGAVRTQEAWIQYFNELSERRGVPTLMISSPDVYRTGQERNPRLIKSLRQDCDESWLVTGTRENYEPDTLDARITYDYGNTVVKTTPKKVLVPVYSDTLLDKVLEDQKGVAYLQAKFDTQDNPDEIVRTLAALSGKSPDSIIIWTPDQAGRAGYPERAAGFVFCGGRFRVDGGDWVGGGVGRSRGVSVKSAKPTRKNKR